jgi:hypothetical protein
MGKIQHNVEMRLAVNDTKMELLAEKVDKTHDMVETVMKAMA